MRVVGNGGFNSEKSAKLGDGSCGGGLGNVEEKKEDEEQPHFWSIFVFWIFFSVPEMDLRGKGKKVGVKTGESE